MVRWLVFAQQAVAAHSAPGVTATKAAHHNTT
jgi:hypothetical protein